MKNVRCFAEEQRFELRPLTFLVGENSTGKTTMMGCLSAIHHFLLSERTTFVDFNQEPYSMGSFVNISRISNEENNKNKNCFEIGFNHSGEQIQCCFQFVEGDQGEPVIGEMDIHHKNNKFSVNRNGKIFSYKGERFEISIFRKEGFSLFGVPGIFKLVPAYSSKHLQIQSILWEGKILSQLPKIIQDPYDFLIDIFDKAMVTLNDNFESNDEDFTLKQEEKENKELLKQLQQKHKEDKELLEKTQEEYKSSLKYQEAWYLKKKYRPPWDILINIFNLAPIRSKPQRTYDPITKEYNSPQGTDIPVTLLQISRNDFLWGKIYKQMLEFGKASGLFSDIEVKKFGESSGNPFQLLFKVRGSWSNVIDTGYGVSQILPMLIHLFHNYSMGHSEGIYHKKKEKWFLLQQPEVHLHPKAQAELASLFVHSTKTDNTFLIETHSDFMIERTVIEIRKGNISPKDVSLIYFEAGDDGVKVHNLSFDDQGNLLNAPKGYRDFFIKESNCFLGFED